MNRLGICALAAAVLAGTTTADIKTYNVAIDGTQEVPPNGSPGTGFAVVVLDTDTGDITVNGSFQDLLAPATVSHIHSPALPTQNAGVILPLTVDNAVAGNVSGIGVLTAQQVDDTVNGLSYINIHTSAFPGGEIRGQIQQLGECFLVVGDGPGTSVLEVNDHAFWFQVENMRHWNSVLLDHPAEIPIDISPAPPSAPFGGATLVSNYGDLASARRYTAQIMMFMPQVFPHHPEQWTHGMNVWVLPDGRVLTRYFGGSTGMTITAEVGTNAAGETVLRFPFTIPGI